MNTEQNHTINAEKSFSPVPKLSIIIPIYNEEELLPEVFRQIRSVPW